MLPSILMLILCPNPGNALALTSEVITNKPARLVSYSKGFRLSLSVRRGMTGKEIEKLLGKPSPSFSAGFFQDGGKVTVFSWLDFAEYGLSVKLKSSGNPPKMLVDSVSWDGWRLLLGENLYDLYFWWVASRLRFVPHSVSE